MVALAFFRGGSLVDSESRYNEALSEADEMEQNEQNAIGLAEDVEQINKIVEETESRLMRENARADHYRYFLSLAEGSKVTMSDPVMIRSLVPGTKGVNVVTQKLAQIEYRLSLQGNFNQIMDFLYLLSTGRYLTRVDAMAMAGEPDMGPDIVTVNLSIRILATPPPKEKKEDKNG
ncbi:hypothetical protein [Ruficoccus sp. ZRK36]|uniref:hypothetical protein n=1 Tax=Ruficoccus sp. ZRK36 TaxID=2866311 RepID=UPI001C733039|nr:hypothetical protein [Ruficoccus sp. ZRK36]QYY37188.1 hypothetical protein K0V07_06815 [Ruficoccus sp. ZRK36]